MILENICRVVLIIKRGNGSNLQLHNHYTYQELMGGFMGLRFRRSIKISKGVKVNLGKTGVSTTFGTRGLHYTMHSSGRRTSSAGIPGTGLSFVSQSGGSHKRKSASSTRSKAQHKSYAQKQREAEYVKNSEMVDDYNELIDQIKSIHEECSDSVDWVEIRDRPAPFDTMYMGPYEAEARRALEAVKPSLIGRLIPSADRRRIESLEQEIQEARERDRQLYSDWENMRKLATQVIAGDIDSYFYVVSEMHPFDDILDFGSDFDIGTDIPDLMEVEFHAKTSKVVPNHVLSLTQTGKLSSKVMSKTMHFDIAQDYICSCVLRVAREMFALLPINRVVIHVVDEVEDVTGEKHDETVLSSLIRRDQLAGINFGLIDPSDTIESFDCNMNFKKTQGLKPVPRIEF